MATQVSIKTLLGDYVEKASNHDRKVFQKVHQKDELPSGKKLLDVLLYYWDDRENQAYKGWWFGNTVGGVQVWAYNPDNGLEPPRIGWKIPWNASPHPDFRVGKKAERSAKDAQQQLALLTNKVDENESILQEGLAKSRALIDHAGGLEKAETELLKEVEDSLLPTVFAFGDVEKQAAEALKVAAEAAAAGAPEAAAAMRQLRALGKRVHARKEELALHLSKLKSRRISAEESRKKAAMESTDTQKLGMILPEALRRVNDAEDLVEKAAIQLELVEACADDEATHEQAVADADRVATMAMKAITETKAFLLDKTELTSTFVQTVRQRAQEELGKLTARITEADARLRPALAVKQEAADRREVERIMEHLEDRMARAELDVDRAEEVSVVLSSDASSESLKTAQKAYELATSSVDAVMKVLQQHKKTASVGVSKAVDELLGVRGAKATEQLGKVKARLRCGTEQVTTSGLLVEAEERIAGAKTAVGALEAASVAADAALEQLSELVRRSLAGTSSDVEELHVLKSTEAKLRAPELAATTAQSATATAKSFLQVKALEVNKFSGEHVEAGKTGLSELRRQLDGTSDRIQQFKDAAAKRRRQALVKEGELKLARADRSLSALDAATAVFLQDLPAEMTAQSAREAAMQAQRQERIVGEHLADTKRFLAARQIELRGKSCTQEETEAWAALSTRMAAIPSQLENIRKRHTTLEQRLAARKVVLEAEAKLSDAAEKVTSAVDAAEALSSPSEGVAPAKAAEVAVREATLSVRSAQRFLESSTAAFAKDALVALKPKLEAAQARLEVASNLVRDHAERGFLHSFSVEVQQKWADVSRVLSEAELAAEALPDDPSRGVESDEVEVGRRALAIERSIQAAQTGLNGAKTFLTVKRMSVKGLSEAGRSAAEAQLIEFQGRLETVAAKLSGLRAKVVEFKMAAMSKRS